MLEEALTEHDAEGVYYDLLLFLLGAILRTHLEEEEEEGLDGSHDHEPLMDVDDEGDEKSQSTVSASATMAAAWPMQYQGKPLHELIMDPFTSSELLRLHLLSSGARIGMSELKSVAFQAYAFLDFIWCHSSHIDEPKQPNKAMLMSQTNLVGFQLFSFTRL